MTSYIKLSLIATALTGFFLLFAPLQAFGQEFSSGVATYVPVQGDNVLPGAIVSFTNDSYALSKATYDPTVYGVVVSDQAVSLENQNADEKNTYPVITTGKVFIRVTTANGPIKAGSLIASSETPGVGQLATEDGYVVATALEDYTDSDTTKIGTVYASMNLGFYSSSTTLRKNLFSNLQRTFVSPFVTPVNTLRYLIAGLAVLLGLTIGLLHFGRSTSSGIEALGRNPLARNAIFVSMLLNLLLTLAAMGAGLGIAYLILAL
jgi:F0F1-type ATP synthase membrane subunit c/vacuolar-type H+-ATPase subunit K